LNTKIVREFAQILLIFGKFFLQNCYFFPKFFALAIGGNFIMQRRFIFYRQFIALVIILAGLTFAQAQSLGSEQKAEIVNKIADLLSKNYVFPETAQKMDVFVRQRLKQGAYSQITDEREFARVLTEDLQSVSRDLHLRVSFSPEIIPTESAQPFELSKEEMEKIRRSQARQNFGVAKVEILKGNIGLIQFNYFTNPNWAGETYTAVMNYVANADALIIDLRYNGGSMHPDAIPFLCSYFFETPVHLNDIYWRPENSTRQFWTYPQVSGKRFIHKPIYILTSRRTFSGGEEITYDLQNLKRATVVGETTGGGAHGGGDRRINDHFSIWIPIGRAINPITKTNWEGTGVKPDIEIQTNKALYTGHLQALNEVSKQTQEADLKENLKSIADEINLKMQNFKKVAFKLKGFETAQNVYLAGEFNGWSNRSLKMTQSGGEWTAQVELEPGRHAYKFVVDGRWIIDPANSQTEGTGDTQNSIVEVK
jgi:hypothetical protein